MSLMGVDLTCLLFTGNHTADLYWHGAGFDEGLYNKPGVYAVNKLPGMVELTQKVSFACKFANNILTVVGSVA